MWKSASASSSDARRYLFHLEDALPPSPATTFRSSPSQSRSLRMGEAVLVHVTRRGVRRRPRSVERAAPGDAVGPFRAVRGCCCTVVYGRRWAVCCGGERAAVR